MSELATDRVTVIKPGQTYVGKQGFTYGAGASAGRGYRFVAGTAEHE